MPKKRNCQKWPFSDQNHGLTPLEKCHIFVVSNFFFLYYRKTFFRSRISSKTFFWRLLPKKKKLEKSPFLDQNHGLTPFMEKCQFFVFLNLLFLYYRVERRVVVLEYHQRHFSGVYCLKKKSWKNRLFWTKTMG